MQMGRALKKKKKKIQVPGWAYLGGLFIYFFYHSLRREPSHLIISNISHYFGSHLHSLLQPHAHGQQPARLRKQRARPSN